MSEKNICQNPKCCDRDTLDRWNKKTDKYHSRKAYFKSHNEYGSTMLEYFCTTGCANQWLNNNIERIIDHRGTIEKILEKKIRA